MTRDVERAYRQELADKIGGDRFELWFERHNSPRWRDDRMVVCAPDAFTLDWLRTNFHATLVQVGKQLELDVASPLYEVELASESNSEVKETSDNLSSKPSPAESDSAAVASPRPVRQRQLPQFIVGDNNRMAVAAAQHLLDHLGEVTPFFVAGPTGSGKTHLLQAIYKDARMSGRIGRSAYLSAEQFTSAFLEALHGRGLPSFRAKYRDVDLLLIDDVHFLAGKRATLVEFHHTVDQLLRMGKQVVLSSNRLPTELSELGSELVARFSSGLVCSVDYPQDDTKAQLVQTLAKQKGLMISPEIQELLVTDISGDARQLSGALNRILALRLAGIDSPPFDVVREHLRDMLGTHQPSVGIQEVENAVCEAFGIQEAMLKSSDKSRQFSQPRMLAMWLARRHTRAALSEIGDYFGGRSHSTVIAAQRTVEKWVQSEKQIGTTRRPVRVEDAIRRIERRLRCS